MQKQRLRLSVRPNALKISWNKSFQHLNSLPLLTEVICLGILREASHAHELQHSYTLYEKKELTYPRHDVSISIYLSQGKINNSWHLVKFTNYRICRTLLNLISYCLEHYYTIFPRNSWRHILCYVQIICVELMPPVINGNSQCLLLTHPV